MALFGQVDADLPLLTQFYQLEMTPPVSLADVGSSVAYWNLRSSELDVWVGCETWRRTPEGDVLWRQGGGDVGKIGFTFSSAVAREGDEPWYSEFIATLESGLDEREYYRQVVVLLLQEFAALHPPVCRIMDNAVGVAIPREQLEQDLALLNAHYRRLPPALHLSLTGQDEVQSASIGPYYLKQALLDELSAVLRPPAWTRSRVMLARCLECQNPFVILRSGQKYCSHRCGARVHIRERRKQEKQEKPKYVESV